MILSDDDYDGLRLWSAPLTSAARRLAISAMIASKPSSCFAPIDDEGVDKVLEPQRCVTRDPPSVLSCIRLVAGNRLLLT